VLGRFRPGERDAIDAAIPKAALAALTWAREGIAIAMNRANGPEESEKPKKKDRRDKPGGSQENKDTPTPNE
jgi:hypothetical protein